MKTANDLQMANYVTAEMLLVLGRMTTSELLGGIVLYNRSELFSDQVLFQLFADLEQTSPALRGRLGIEGGKWNRSSASLRDALSFMRMGQILFHTDLGIVGETYRINPDMKPAIQNFLSERVGESGHTALRQLALYFNQLINTRQITLTAYR